LPQTPLAGRVLVIALMLASLFYFNRDDGLDNWAIYFFGAYGLGATVYWNVQRGKAPTWLGLIVSLAVAALVIDFRLRIAVALCVAIALGLARYSGFIESWPRSKFIAWLGQISYSVFLVHYPICLMVNTLFERFMPHTPAIQLFGMVVAWIASIGAGALFYQQVECRAQRLLARKASLTQAAP